MNVMGLNERGPATSEMWEQALLSNAHLTNCPTKSARFIWQIESGSVELIQACSNDTPNHSIVSV